ncbi:MAG: signal peptide peptidase SppA [Candidatus Sumerlaeota bacterium]|nr:signal peptide peptidase SppA [Candidatus Sumerlaeota bacterium]
MKSRNASDRFAVARRQGRFILACAAAISMLGLLSGCIIIPISGLRASAQLKEVEIQPAKHWLTTDKVLMVDLTGVISSSSRGWLGAEKGTVERLKDILKKASQDSSVAAVVLRINSPGGGVTESDLCYREIMKFKEQVKKEQARDVPVIAIMMDVAASGGYYVAMAADEIWAHPTTITGSIGVIMTLPHLQGLTSKIGVDMQVIKSGKMKDVGSIWREMTPEERQLLQGLIDSMYGQFVGVVTKGRGLKEDKVRELADGRVYTAAQAKDAKLIDQIGYIEDAIAAAQQHAKIKDSSVIAYTQGWEEKTNFYSQINPAAPSASSQINLVNIDMGSFLQPGAPKLYYLWMP